MSNYRPHKLQEELMNELQKHKGGVHVGGSGYGQKYDTGIIMSLINAAKRHMIQQEIQEFVDKKLGNKD